MLIKIFAKIKIAFYQLYHYQFALQWGKKDRLLNCYSKPLFHMLGICTVQRWQSQRFLKITTCSLTVKTMDISLLSLDFLDDMLVTMLASTKLCNPGSSSLQIISRIWKLRVKIRIQAQVGSDICSSYVTTIIVRNVFQRKKIAKNKIGWPHGRPWWSRSKVKVTYTTIATLGVLMAESPSKKMGMQMKN